MTTDMDKDEIAQEVEHHREMVRALKRHLQVLERTKALKGIDTGPHILLGIEDYTKDIQHHEEKIRHLQTLAAVDKESLAEVEYRMLVAEAWDTPARRPSIAATAKLEYQRLRLGVTAERAQAIERETRIKLVKEAFRDIKRRFYRSDTFDLSIHPDPLLLTENLRTSLSLEDLNQLEIVATIEYPRIYDKEWVSLALIVQCILLDHSTTLEMFIENFSKEPIEIRNIRYSLTMPSNSGINATPPEEFNDRTFWVDVLFQTFKRNLKRAEGASGVDTDMPIETFVSELCDAVVKS